MADDCCSGRCIPAPECSVWTAHSGTGMQRAALTYWDFLSTVICSKFRLHTKIGYTGVAVAGCSDHWIQRLNRQPSNLYRSVVSTIEKRYDSYVGSHARLVSHCALFFTLVLRSQLFHIHFPHAFF